MHCEIFPFFHVQLRFVDRSKFRDPRVRTRNPIDRSASIGKPQAVGHVSSTINETMEKRARDEREVEYKCVYTCRYMHQGVRRESERSVGRSVPAISQVTKREKGEGGEGDERASRTFQCTWCDRCTGKVHTRSTHCSEMETERQLVHATASNIGKVCVCMLYTFLSRGDSFLCAIESC